jgi:hypothetical protein
MSQVSVPVETMTGEKKVFLVRFNSKETTIDDAAASFCDNQRAIFEVDDSTIQDNCIKPVAEFMRLKLQEPSS